ncbi:MAG: hypothetical protein DYH07_12705 [Armatimonadetes bacterium ATM1]|nr:MAG: hypothetical protein EDM73_12770 [Armatimonadota bacterium]MBC6970795.1 hypothetical protein [Armatimonadota bacterium]MCE7900934.1 hypothetical protein [Armatimonadetes bacterium ATM1]RIJ94829.1 MAG: hypothetical protein DCC45_11745 [Armatimonadota bacterium]
MTAGVGSVRPTGRIRPIARESHDCVTHAIAFGDRMERVDIKLAATKEQAGEPWIWRLSRDFNVKVTIRKAVVDEDQGWMLIALEGPLEEVQRATAWLHTTGLHVEPLQRSLGA